MKHDTIRCDTKGYNAIRYNAMEWNGSESRDGRKAAGQDCDYWPGVNPAPACPVIVLFILNLFIVIVLFIVNLFIVITLLIVIIFVRAGL